jgi:hypothetical protein
MHGMLLIAKLFDSDIPRWDVSRVTNMGRMFSGAGAFNHDISRWDVRDMFRGAAEFNQNISRWDASKVLEAYCPFMTETSKHPRGFLVSIGPHKQSSGVGVRYEPRPRKASERGLGRNAAHHRAIRHLIKQYAAASMFNHNSRLKRLTDCQ